MAVYTIEKVATCNVTAPRLFKAMILERHSTIKKVRPNSFKSNELIQGDGDVGSIYKTLFADGHPLKYIMSRIDALDVENFYCKYTIFEGGILRDNLESIVYEVKYEALGDSCSAKVTVHYNPKPGCSVNQDEVNVAEEKSYKLLNAVVEYLLANPEVCA